MHYDAFTLQGAFWAFVPIFSVTWLILDMVTMIKREAVQISAIALISFLFALVVTDLMLIAGLI